METPNFDKNFEDLTDVYRDQIKETEYEPGADTNPVTRIDGGKVPNKPGLDYYDNRRERHEKTGKLIPYQGTFGKFKKD